MATALDNYPLSNPKQRLIQETLLQFGIPARIARRNGQIELRNFDQKQILTTLNKLQKHGPDLNSFNFAAPGLTSLLARLIFKNSAGQAWLKPPMDLMRRSAKESLALCVNSAGEWSLRKAGYYAISHVWEEGIRADSGNRGMPLAQVQQIIQRIHQVGAEWIWLDTLAIPAAARSLTLEEEELKIAIINNLAAIFRQAESVIIFDALTMQLQSTDYIDTAVCLSCGKWNTRIWTFQEIYLARKAIVITATGVVDYLAMTRRLRALSGNQSEVPELFGSYRSDLDVVNEAEKSPPKYQELYLLLVRLLGCDGKQPSLGQLAMLCHNRKTGNDIDYARAFFPVLGLSWKNGLSREQGMEMIYNEQQYYSKRLLLMSGSPRSLGRPGWAPSYLNGLIGRPIAPDHPLGDIEWLQRGLKRNWYAYKVQHWRAIDRELAFLLEVESQDSSELCGGMISENERPEAVDRFKDVISRQCAYILANAELVKLSRTESAYRVMLVERNEAISDRNEAWVYLTVEMVPMEKSLPAKDTSWLILHESPLSDYFLNGKAFSEIRNMLSDESVFHGKQTPLHVAAHEGDVETLQRLLVTSNEDQISARDDRGWTPLHAAALSGQVPSIQILLSHGLLVDAEDSSERTALMIAADNGHTSAVSELLRHGADVNLSRKNALCPLNQALLRGHVETVEVLLQAGANPSGCDAFGFPPLFLIAGSRSQIKSVELATMLFASGADPSGDLVGGAGAIHFAARAGNVPLLEMLLNLDIPVDLPEADGITALYRAVEEQHESTVTMLLQRGANPNASAKNGWTCALLAAQIGNYDMMKMLIQGGADVRSTCQPEGWTALHIACSNGHRRIVRLLLGNGWDANTKDVSRRLPLQLAEQAGHVEIVSLLRNFYRAAPNCRE